MRATKCALVAYSSSDDDNDSEERPRKKRKLPSIPTSLIAPNPIDRPQLHQGRIRTVAHVEGQWTAHVYVSLLIERGPGMYTLLDEVLSHSKCKTPSLNDFWLDKDSSRTRKLHISLSRPTYLRAHQRENLKKAVKNISQKFSPFRVSFATFSELVNDERTRTFLTVEVGAGHNELHAMSNALTPTLKAIRQREFYHDPRFHASIAWALLEQPREECRASAAVVDPIISSESLEPVDATPFPTVPHLPKNLIVELNELFGAKLSAPKTGAFDVEAITIKIGKDIHTWPLSGL